MESRQDAHRWAGTYNGMIDDVFSIQEQVARKIVEALQLRLTATEERHLSERAINNVPAYECYLRARHDSGAGTVMRLIAPCNSPNRPWRSSEHI